MWKLIFEALIAYSGWLFSLVVGIVAFAKLEIRIGNITLDFGRKPASFLPAPVLGTRPPGATNLLHWRAEKRVWEARRVYWCTLAAFAGSIILPFAGCSAAYLLQYLHAVQYVACMMVVMLWVMMMPIVMVMGANPKEFAGSYLFDKHLSIEEYQHIIAHPWVKKKRMTKSSAFWSTYAKLRRHHSDEALAYR